MNYQMQGLLRQLQNEIKEAEESGDELKKKRAEVLVHYLLIKTHTLRKGSQNGVKSGKSLKIKIHFFLKFRFF